MKSKHKQAKCRITELLTDAKYAKRRKEYELLRAGQSADKMVFSPLLKEMRDEPPNYEGQYIALSAVGDKKVIAHGLEIGPVFDEARRLEPDEVPTIVFVPRHDVIYVY